MRQLLIIFLFTFTTITCTAKDFSILSRHDIHICVPANIQPIVDSAVEMFRGDVHSVFDKTGIVCTGNGKKADIILGIDSRLPREGFRINVHKGRLTITGADDHGLAYGLLEVSRMIGVSPWVYWADSTPRHRDMFTLADGYQEEQHPAVAYRGIFINDEDWGMNPWATRNEPEAWTMKSGRIRGAIGPKTNEKIFQLLLRLRANYYWPAMHECSQPFFTIKGNREMAKRYGIYIGGSHCEPMATSPAVEWGVRGHGDYNYVTNRDSVMMFWRERLEEVKDQEIVYTLGMRGVHDGAMQGVKTKEDKLKYLQQVINDQRRMLEDVIGSAGKELTDIPQVFIPYKEVLETYHCGLHVPDDVTLMWTDDNYGYIRHFPDSTERQRRGGNGLYYHLSYWGRPHDYLWLNSMPPQVMVPQLTEAYQRGIRSIWVANVGDLKPGEYQTELFLDMAWQGCSGNSLQGCSGNSLQGCDNRNWYEAFFTREFGDSIARPVAEVMAEHFRLMTDCKPEFMGGTRTEEKDKTYWNAIHPASNDWTNDDVTQRVQSYKAISDKVEQIGRSMLPDRRDAFFEMVRYPVQGAAQMNFKFLCPDICEEAYDSIQTLTRIYNKVCAGGKWDGIMSCAPRNLPVFRKVKAEELPTYPASNGMKELHKEGDVFECTTPAGTDSITVEVRVVPHHPITGDRISFTIATDDGTPLSIDYQTYDRNEEWKENVLRGYARRLVTLAVDRTRTKHAIRLLIPDNIPSQTFPSALPRIFLRKNLAD